MSDLEKTVAIIFNGVDNVSGTLAALSGKVNRFSGDLKTIGDPFHQITKGVAALDLALAALTAGGLVYSVNQFAGFEDKMLKVKGVIGASQEEYRQLMNGR